MCKKKSQFCAGLPQAKPLITDDDLTCGPDRDSYREKEVIGIDVMKHGFALNLLVHHS